MPWRLSIVEVGRIPDLPRSLYVPDAAPDDTLDVPCFVYVLDDGARVALVDSGPDSRAAAAHGYRIEGNTTSALLRGVAGHGASALDVGLIVHTHLHYDHCQNDSLFPNSSVVVQQSELAHARDDVRFYEGVEATRGALGPRLVSIDGDAQLLPGLRAVHNGGHTPGHQSVVVETAEGAVCLCGDIVSLAANLSTIGSVCSDREATQAFLHRAAEEGWEMIPSHEPALRSHRWFTAT